MTTMARTERADLCDLALQVGEAEATLCGDWTVKELVVHLLIRERNLVAAPGILVPGLAAVTDRFSRRLRDSTDFTVLVERLRQGPPAYSPLGWGPLDGLANTVELFVHHEDIRRAQPGWRPRVLTSGQQAWLWRYLRVSGRPLARRSPTALVAERSDASAESTVLHRGRDPVVVRGRPSELVLFAFGRRPHAEVRYDGTEQQLASLERARLGF